MKPFTKLEVASLVIIFAVLIAVSIPNFIISLRRARDQVRRDDMGALETSLAGYFADFKSFPPASPDGRIMHCLKSGDKPVKNSKGTWTINPIPCDWGKDSLTDLITGKVYMSKLPQDPDSQKGAKYLYFTDGNRYQIYATMEERGAAEVDPKIIARGLACGSRICNVGRSYNVPINISIEEYDKQLLQK